MSEFIKIFTFFVIVIAFTSCSTNEVKKSNFENSQKALLVMDMQVDLIDENGKFPIEKSQINSLIEKVNSIINDYYSNDYIIIYIRNIVKKGNIKNIFLNNATKEGTSGIEIDPRINIVSENIFDKYKGSALSNESFNNFLKNNKIGELYLCGVMANGCVYRTSLDAFKRGYNVNYISNAVGARNEKDIESTIVRLRKKGINIIEK